MSKDYSMLTINKPEHLFKKDDFQKAVLPKEEIEYRNV